MRGVIQKEKPENAFKNLFLRDKPVEMLIFLKRGSTPKYATQVSKGVDCTYSHTVKVLNKFKELGLVEFKKKGRIKLIALTPDGEEIAHDFEGVVRKFSRAKIGIKKEPEKNTKNTKK